MAAFTILTHGNDPPVEASVGLPAQTPATAPPPSAKRRPTTHEPAREASDAAIDEMPLPQVVLQLPDLKASSGWSERFRLPITSALYWVALAVGALLALWLLSGGSKPFKRSADDAPAWKQPAAEPSGGHRAPWRGNSASAPPEMPRWQNSPQETKSSPMDIAPSAAPSAESQPPATPGAAPDATPYPGAPYLPSTDQSSSSSQALGDVRTARGGQTQWDGTAAPIPPGSAAPLGISSPVQP
jgi:hypothetical protein